MPSFPVEISGLKEIGMVLTLVVWEKASENILRHLSPKRSLFAKVKI